MHILGTSRKVVLPGAAWGAPVTVSKEEQKQCLTRHVHQVGPISSHDESSSLVVGILNMESRPRVNSRGVFKTMSRAHHQSLSWVFKT